MEYNVNGRSTMKIRIDICNSIQRGIHMKHAVSIRLTSLFLSLVLCLTLVQPASAAEISSVRRSLLRAVSVSSDPADPSAPDAVRSPGSFLFAGTEEGFTASEQYLRAIEALSNPKPQVEPEAYESPFHGETYEIDDLAIS